MRAFIVLCVISLVFTTACTPKQKMQVQQKEAREQKLFNEQGNTVIPMTQINGEYYVSADQWVDSMQYNARRDGKGISFGFTDKLFEFNAGSNEALIGGEMVQLKNPPIWERDELWLPASTIREWFQDEAQFDIRENQIILIRNSEMLDPYNEDSLGTPNESDEELDFAEEETGDQSDQQGNQFTIQSNQGIGVDNFISRAKKYLGVKYEFGAKKYSQSGRFDCSSYVQHLFNSFGEDFPRVSRNQAKYGFTVSRKNLKKGDLLYFYVPGRFNSNKTIGHVGIYIGNGNMIHSSPAPKNGVQITSINKKYWKETFITAKRVLKQ